MRRILLFASVSLLAVACNLYPGQDARTEMLDVVITARNPDTDFQKLKTYALTTHIKPIGPDSNNLPVVDKDLEKVVLSTIRSNMNAYSWEEVDTSMSPDMAIDVGYALGRNTNVYGSYPGYGWGYPGYGWYYPYWGFTAVSSYDVGSVIIVGLDLNNIDSVNQLIPTHWNALIQGPAVGNVDDPEARVQRDVNQAFDQSTYLQLK